MKKTLVTALSATMVASSLAPSTVSAETATAKEETTQLLVQYKDSETITKKEAKKLDATIVSNEDQTAVIDVLVEDEQHVIETLQADENVEFVEENKVYTLSDEAASTEASTSTSVNDTYYGNQWNLSSLNIEKAWEQAKDVTDKDETVVAVLDTGVKATHADLKERVLEGTTIVEGIANNETGNDDQGHGTFVSGIIAAQANNDTGISGVAGTEDVKILPVKVMGKNGEGTAADIAKGIDYAVAHDADVINMSLSGEYSEAIDQAVQRAYEEGVVVVAASGNGGGNADTNYPAALDNVISVGSVAKNNQAYSGSNVGETVDLVAPGVSVISTSLAGDLGDESGYYTSGTGTSYAAPHVAAVAALYKAQHADASAEKVTQALIQTADDLGVEGHDPSTGYGVVNPLRALENDVQVDAFKLDAPKKNANVVGMTPVIVTTEDDAITSMSVTIDGKKVASGEVEQHQFNQSFDTTEWADGKHTIIITGLDKENKEVSKVERTINVQNMPVSGYMFSVQAPSGKVAKGAAVKLYEQDEEGNYSELWTGATDQAGAVRVPSHIGTDLKDVHVVVQGKFDDAEGKNSWFMYSRDLNTTGVVTLSGDKMSKVSLATKDKAGKAYTGAQYFLSAQDAQGKTVGEMTAINKIDSKEDPTLYLDEAAYNVFSYAKKDGDTYFLSTTNQKINKATSLTFDASTAGKLTVDNSDGKLENAVLYVYNDAMNEAFGDGIATGRNFYVTAGDYRYIVDAEVKNDTTDGKGNWIYSLADMTKANVVANKETTLHVGGQIKASIKSNQEAVKAYAKQRGVNYTERKDENDAYKLDAAFYTKQEFLDAYDNVLVGMKRGSLTEADALYKKDVETGETAVQGDEEWSIESKDFGDIYANYTVTRKSDSKVLLDSDAKNPTNPANRGYYMNSFFIITGKDYVAGDYDVTVESKVSPLTKDENGNAAKASLTMHLNDTSSVLELQNSDGVNVATYTTLLRASKDESGNISWKQYFNQNSDSSSKALAIPENVQQSELTGGNVAIIRYVVPNSGNKFGYIFKQFNDVKELNTKMSIPDDMREVTIKEMDGDEKIDNISTKLWMIKKKMTVDGQEAYPTVNNLQVYKNQSIYLQADKTQNYVIEGNYVTLPDKDGKQNNYYFLNDNVQVDAKKENEVIFNKEDLAQVKIKANTEGFNNFRGAILYPYNKYSSSFTSALRTGHNFFVPSNLEMDLQAQVGFGDADDTNKTWNYYFSKGEQVFEAGDISTWRVGGQLKTAVTPSKSNYGAGEEVSATASITDSYGNKLSSVLVNKTSDYALSDETATNTKLYEITHGGEAHEAVAGSIKPVASIIDEKGNVVSKLADTMFYNHVHGLTAPTTAGNYRVKLAIAGSPLGIASSETAFTVDSLAVKLTATPSDNKTTMSGTTKPYATVVVKKGSAIVDQVTANKKGVYTLDIGKQKAGTKLTVSITSNGATVSKTVTVVDRTAPKVTSVLATNKSNKVIVKTEKGAKIQLKINGKTYTKTANASGSYTFTFKNLKEATRWSITVTDAAGNATKKSGVVKDVIAPAKPKVTTKVKTTTVTIKGKAEAGSRVTVYKNNKALASAKATSKGQFTLKIKAQKANTKLVFKAKDASKNVSAGTNVVVTK